MCSRRGYSRSARQQTGLSLWCRALEEHDDDQDDHNRCSVKDLACENQIHGTGDDRRLIQAPIRFGLCRDAAGSRLRTV